MKVIYSEVHRQHDPPCQLFSSGLKPYSESASRVEGILAAVLDREDFEVIPPKDYGLEPIRAVHESAFLEFLEGAYSSWEQTGLASEAGIIPDTFAMRSLPGKPKEAFHQAGYYCFETQTPIVRGTFDAAVSAANCALTGADLLLNGEQVAYSLARPPGHHAGLDLYGGYCYINHAAAAARKLSAAGCKVAVLDLDYHHGNGTQSIFYDDQSVMFASIHANPERAYPYYSGFPDETGRGEGRGCNLNFPMESGIDDRQYLSVLDQALDSVQKFGPDALIVSFGADIYASDPLGDFEISLAGFREIGERISLGKTLIVQEGGYHSQDLGKCVLQLLDGFE